MMLLVLLLQGEQKCPPTLSFRAKGGPGGEKIWDDESLYSSIKSLKIFCGHCIDAIQIQYADKNGNLVWSSKHGGNGGTKITEVRLRLAKHREFQNHNERTNS